LHFSDGDLLRLGINGEDVVGEELLLNVGARFVLFIFIVSLFSSFFITSNELEFEICSSSASSSLSESENKYYKLFPRNHFWTIYKFPRNVKNRHIFFHETVFGDIYFPRKLT